MMNQDLLKKLRSEAMLTSEEQGLLDRALGEDLGPETWVALLDCPVPPLAWRSDLDARLMELRPVEQVQANEFELEVRLESPEQLSVASMVKGLPNEEPSLQWRSTLNERLASLRVSAIDAETVDLEVGLDSRPHAQVASWVGALPEEEPSMAWRSRLNERLRALGPSAKRKPFWSAWRLAGAGAVTAAAALALAVIVLKPTNPEPGRPQVGKETAIEARLIAAHQESAGAMDLGANSGVPTAAGNATDVTSPWSESDLDTL